MPNAVIQIPVEEDAARAFARTPDDDQRFWADAIACWALGTASRVRTMGEVADDASAEAEANGLTPEILDDILRG